MKTEILKKTLGTALDVLFTLVLLITLAAAAVTLALREQGALGLRFGVVRSASMEESGLYVGDVVYVGRDDEYAVGDVVAFYRAPELYDEPFEKEAVRGREIWIHQIVAVRTDENGRSSFLTKGTSNAADDGYYVPQDYVIGKASALPALIGGLIGFLATSTGIICLIVLPCAVMLIYLIWDLIMLLTTKEEPLKSAAAECVCAEESFAEETLTKACPEPPEQAVSAVPPPPPPQEAGVPVTAAGADGAQAKTTAAAPNAAESEKIVNPKRGRKCRGPKRRDRRPQELRN